MKIIMSIIVGFFGIMSAYASESVQVYTAACPQQAFVLFYSASCPHCQRFDPILKRYAVSHHIPVLAYTVDGRSLSSFPHSVLPSQAEMTHFFPAGHPVVPTLFLMDITHHNIIPVLQGEATAAQLDHRMQHVQSLGDANENN